MLVTIEGVVNSDVVAEGARHTVEWTPRLRGLMNSGLIRVIDWSPTPASEPAPAQAEPEQVEPEQVESETRPRSRRRRSSEE
ncbi:MULTISPECIES: hypothetical protein [Nocardia]|uniref:hypothetical protein n=1 Tax=Nocardia TaxID=1817 RepID=UPI002458201C|nr:MULTISPECIES: hypothetical protein [Nocardia]